MAEGLSGYESPSYIYGSVLAMFLILSILIERVLEFVEHRLHKFNRNGLSVALNSVVKEVMMLGFISLLLTVVEDKIADICVNNFTHIDRWTAISHIPSCDTCLEHTQGLSQRYKDKHHCTFWDDHGSDDHHDDKTAHGKSYHGSDEHAHEKSHKDDEHAHEKSDHGSDDHHDDTTAHEESHHDDDHHATLDPTVHLRRLLAGGGGNQCGEGKEPLVSTALLHEAHIAIFMLTIIHIANVVFMVILASWKLRRWRKWKLDDDKYALCVSSGAVTLQTLESEDSFPEEITIEGQSKQPLNQQGRDVASSSRPLQRVETFKKSGSVFKILHQASEIDPESNKLEKAVRWQREWSISFFKQFISPVTQEEFRIMRAAFMLEHHRSQTFDFMNYLTNALDDDVCHVVQMPILGWIAFILVTTFWAPITYTGWVFGCAAIVFVLFVTTICTKLVTVVRHVTRGGRINKLEPTIFWRKNPRLLLPVIQSALFINSTIFAIMATLSSHYGRRSCIFYGHQVNGHLRYWSWITILVLNLCIFLHMSFVMLPTYSLVVHMGSTHWSHHLINSEVKDKLRELGKKIKLQHQSSPDSRS